jgi:hypothetical protein
MPDLSPLLLYFPFSFCAQGHYEWQIRFSPHDINMASIRVIFDDEAQLSIHVERRNPCIVSML